MVARTLWVATVFWMFTRVCLVIVRVFARVFWEVARAVLDGFLVIARVFWTVPMV